ncbi:MAG: pyruvate formate lyase family protein [Smithellaceae bacterium]|nr:pyruvate formate lyase family protein [Smithellaceae bacterium]
MSYRTQRLMVNTPIKAQQVALQELSDDARSTRPGLSWSIDLERARLLTKSYRATEGEPMGIRRAKALAHILDNMTIYINPEEIIVGNYCSNKDSVPFYPELAWKWIARETAPGQVYANLLTDEGRAELQEIGNYWGDKSIHHRMRSYLPKELTEVFWVFNYEASTPNYEKILSVGLSGLIAETKQRLETLDKDYLAETMTGQEFLKKKNFLEGALITLEAAIRWGKRYAALAKELAAKEKDPARKAELESIIAACEHVPEHPARNLQEALQCYWLIHLIINFIDLPQVGSGVRFDVVFNPYYERDLAAGKITRDQAQELVEFLFVKFQETGFLHPPIWSGFGGGTLGFQTVTLGGTDADGNDITNEMSYILLDATLGIRAIVPPLALRWHDKMPKKLVAKAIELMASGMPQPAIFNDKVNVPRLLKLGCPLEDARLYSINNCMVPTIPGKNFSHISAWASGVPIALCFTQALGMDPLAIYKKAGRRTIDPKKLSSMEELMDAAVENYSWVIHRLTLVGNIADALYEEYAPRPFLSSLIDDCITRAQDVREWNYKPDYRDITLFGLNTTADSLAAVKKIVFDEKKATMEELLAALKANWKGYEKLKKMCLDAPKFGNDDDYVDLVSRELARRISDETSKCKTNRGTPVIADGTAATAWWSFGRVCAATPDGRDMCEPFNDGTISPMAGRDKLGPTAVLKSVSKVDPLISWNHLFNQSFMPNYLTGHNAETFAQYLKTFGDLGIHHIQFTTVARETLQDAQANPERYPNLMVRVAGFAAYFIDLDRSIQDSIIARTPQCL